MAHSITYSLKFRMTRLAVLLLVTLAFLILTHPVKVPALMLVLPFMLLFATLYYALVEVFNLLRPAEPEDDAPAPVHRTRLLAALLAGFPVILLVLQSIMQLNRWDVLIALAIFLLAYIFITRGSVPILRR